MNLPAYVAFKKGDKVLNPLTGTGGEVIRVKGIFPKILVSYKCNGQLCIHNSISLQRLTK